MLPTGTKGLDLLSRVELPTGTKGIPPLARLAVGPGTKATFCPGPKGNRDKWPGTNAYSVVVLATPVIIYDATYLLPSLHLTF